MNIQEGQYLRDYVTMRIGGPAAYIATVVTEDDVKEAHIFARANNLPIITLGAGSNVVFHDEGFNGVVIVNKILGFDKTSEGLVTVGAGENWDDTVKRTVDARLAGIEGLSLIPGTVGGAPVNNIGAYGQQISDTLLSLKAFDTQAEEFVVLSNEECNFSYRDSRFKTTDHGRFIITSVTLRLTAAESSYTTPTYQSLQAALEAKNITAPTIQDIRDTVIEVRSSKLPDPAVLANCGSFFKNPVVNKNLAEKIIADYPDIPTYPSGEDIKLSAGWMIEQAGLKNYRRNGIWVYENQALVLVNESAEYFNELQNMADYITKTVYDKFGVSLAPEPELL